MGIYCVLSNTSQASVVDHLSSSTAKYDSPQQVEAKKLKITRERLVEHAHLIWPALPHSRLDAVPQISRHVIPPVELMKKSMGRVS